MKKILALVLAATLALGMATTAFASGVNAANTGDEYLDVRFSNAYLADDDDRIVMTSAVNPGSTNIVPGTVLYYEVVGGKATQDNANIMDSGTPTGVKRYTNVSDLKNYRISYSIDDGKNMVKSAKFVKVKDTKGTYHLFVAVETSDNYIMEDTSLDMTLRVTAKSGAFVGANNANYVQDDYVEHSINTTFSYDTGDVGNGYYTVDVNGAVLSFDDDADDVTLCFDEEVEVSGNMKGQKDIFVRLSTSNTAIEDKYPDATIRFFDGNKDTFRRDMNVTIPYESAVEKPYLYEVDANGALKTVSGAKFDDAAGEFKFATKTLGNYIISDTELKSKVDSDDSSTDGTTDSDNSTDKPTDGTQPNPGTGANDFVGLAVALAVVSMAGIAVAKRK